MRDIAIGPFRTGELLVTGLTLTLVFVGGVLPRIGNAIGRVVRPPPPDAPAGSPDADAPPDDA